MNELMRFFSADGPPESNRHAMRSRPEHPISRGWKEFMLHDEPYINNYFGANRANGEGLHRVPVSTIR
jgi:hypothetical protein